MTTESSHEMKSPAKQPLEQEQSSSVHHPNDNNSQDEVSSTTTTTTTTTNNNNNNNSGHIRHSGRVLVRGKIRRVWRPRFLEVWGNGLVRYYEVSPPPVAGNNYSTLDAFVDPNILSSSADLGDLEFDEDDQYHSKSPKCTLWIHHARIIDVTTLRDMHVGLPRGAFGFLFHGHRMDQEDYSDQQAGDFFTSMLMNGYNNYNSNSNNKDMMTPTTLACQGNTNLAQPRDFLCAVPSLEEAQSWVVALQWAASMGRENAYHAPSRFLSSSTAHVGNDDTSHSWEHDTLSVSSSFASQSQLHQPHQQQQQPGPSTPTRTTSATPKKSPPRTAEPETKLENQQPKKSSAGKMVVTKVTGYTLARVDTWQWDVAYQIQVLLVIPSQQQVQEWSIIRTAKDLKHLVDKLSLQQSAKLHKQIELISNLPRVQSSSPTVQQKSTDFKKAISNVDTVLRSLCMEAALVNSPSMKRFLGLRQPSKMNAQSYSFWEIHDSTSISSKPKHTKLHQEKQGTTDQFVKKWLHQQQGQLQALMQSTFSTTILPLLVWYLRLPQPATTYGCLAVVSSWLSASVLPALNRFVSKYNLIPCVSVRLDVLLFSWIAAAGIGHFMIPIMSFLSGKEKVIPERRGGRHAIAAAPSTPSSRQQQQQEPHSGTKEEESAVQSAASPIKKRGESEDVVIDNEYNEDDDIDDDDEGEEDALEATTETSFHKQESHLSSPLPEYNTDEGVTTSCWSKPKDDIFHVRGPNYLKDRVKMPSAPASFTCEGVDMWMTDNPERHIARHPSVLGGTLATTDKDMFLVNFLLPFGNFVSYFSIPPLEEFATPQLADVWSRFIQGDQQYRDARLKLLPVVVDGAWIVKAAVGPGTAPALLGKAIPLQYFFTENHPVSEDGKEKENGGKKNVYEVDVIITASSIAKGILSVVKGHTKALSIAFAFIIEGAKQEELPESVLCSFQVNSLNLDECPHLPDCNLDAQ